MSFTYLQGQAVVSSEEYSWDTDPCALLKSNLIVERYCSPDSKTESFQDFQSGTMCEPLTEDRGVDERILCAEDSPARIYQPLGEVPELMESEVDCGESLQGWFVKWSHDSCSWKTRQCSLLAGLDEFSETWPQWGMMLNGACWALTIPVRHIGESAYGYSLPTPTASDVTGGPVRSDKRTGGDNLRTAVTTWPTPDTCAGGTGPSQLKRNQPRLQDKVKWTTPCARDYKGHTITENFPNWFNQSLANEVLKTWPTPQASDNRDRSNLGMPAIQRRQSKGKQIGLGQSVSDTSGALNPDWVEWLMGWPIGWTDSNPSAMGKFQAWLRSHGKL